MTKQIIIDKSIQRSRVVYKNTGDLVFNYLMIYFFSLLFPAITIDIMFFPKVPTPPSYVIASIFILFDLWLLFNLYFMNKLFVVSDKSLESNKASMLKILEDRYPYISFSTGNPNMIRGQRMETFWRNGKIITVILNEKKLYINVLNTLKGGTLSPITGLTNYLTSWSIGRDLKQAPR